MPEVESTEMMVARLEERFKGMETLFGRMVDEQERMAVSYEELVKSQQRVALVESDIVSLKEGQRLLWQKYDALAAAESKRTERWFYELVKWVLGIAGAMLLYHFGVHPV